jgi:hypothetical protein
MGIILGPLLLFWLGASLYSLWLGYGLLSGDELYLYALHVWGAAIVMMLTYVYFGLARFKKHPQLWAFEIPMFFTGNIFSFLIFLIACLVQLFGLEYFANEYAKAAPFVLIFATSIGAITGFFSTDWYMKRNHIVKTY